MPRGRPAASGYARIAQAEEEEEEEDQYYDDPEDEQTRLSRLSPTQSHGYASIQPGPSSQMPTGTPRRKRHGHRRARTNSGVDLKAINARFERWADEIASKFKMRRVKGKTEDEERLEIHHTVFTAPEAMRPASPQALATSFAVDARNRMTKLEFDDLIESVNVAIELGVHPKLITQGSSGSYFARNSEGKTVGVFKPKDEEPYASRNPKWTKWIHRNLFPFFFGRACLIPNLSYVSEAAAYTLDVRLQTNIVPYTDIVHFSSISFFYDFWERRNYYRKRKPLPPKPGSFQVFLKGYKDATLFLREHPWPDQQSSSLPATSTDKRKRRRRWANNCRPTGALSDDEDEEEVNGDAGRSESSSRRAFWSGDLQQSLREELEKLVVLDYIMRNTDRGLDNWMIRVDEESGEASIVADFPQKTASEMLSDEPSTRKESMALADEHQSGARTTAKIGAIDNSLSWPWKHPDAWRSYPFGWLFLPVSLIGRPFSERTRQHFLPLLTSKHWWSETQVALRKVFAQDSDFKERMFARQIAVMKGQAWNVVETLKTPGHGPLELTRRARVCVWDDLVDVPTVVPMRSPSSRLSQDVSAGAEPHEGDIGSALPRSTTNGILPEIRAPNRFNLSREASTESVPQDALGNVESVLAAGDRPGASRAKTRVSYDQPRPLRPVAGRPRRNLSFSARRMSDHELSDGDGDLGYAAAQEMEGNRKKVIVERLETVKGKPPVFTWC